MPPSERRRDLVAHLADTVVRRESEQLDVGGQVIRLHRLLPEKIRRQVLLVAVAEDRDHDRIVPELVLQLDGPQEVRPENSPRSRSIPTLKKKASGLSPSMASNSNRLAFVADGQHAILYRNGNEVARAPCGPVAESSTLPLMIGASERSGGRQHIWRGRIDEFAVFDRALTPDEIQITASLQP